MSEVEINGKKVKLKPIKAKHQRIFFEQMAELQKNPENVDEYSAFEYELIEALTGTKTEEIDEMTLDEKSKVVGVLFDEMTRKAGFIKPSNNQQDLQAKDMETSLPTTSTKET